MSVVERYLMCAEDLAKLRLPRFKKELATEVEERVMKKEKEIEEVIACVLDLKLYPFLRKSELHTYLSKRKR